MAAHSSVLVWKIPENSMERGAWWVTVHGVAKSQTQLSTRLRKMLIILIKITKLEYRIQIQQLHHKDHILNSTHI